MTVLQNKQYIYLKGEGSSKTIVASMTIHGSVEEVVLMVLADNFIAQGISFKVFFQEIHPNNTFHSLVIYRILQQLIISTTVFSFILYLESINREEKCKKIKFQ